MTAATITSLRQKHYNATVVYRNDANPDLMRIGIQADSPHTEIKSGQFVSLGLGRWEPRVAGTQIDHFDATEAARVVNRAYSISCPMLGDVGPNNERLVPIEAAEILEFYIVLVRGDLNPTTTEPSPLLTPRLFHLRQGDRLKIGRKVTGAYTLDGVHPDHDVLMIGTGTGEAPHNAMTTRLLSQRHRGKIINVTTVRQNVDLAYTDTHDRLMRRHDNYHYLAMTTREPINVDPNHPDFVGKRYVQNEFDSGRLAQRFGVDFDPGRTHVFLCGNPAMIGIPSRGEDTIAGDGMLQILARRGYRSHEELDRHAGETPGPGVVRFERYW